MRKSLLLVSAASIILFAACKKVVTDSPEDIKNPSVIPSAKINAFIKQQIQTNHKFEWSTASDEMVWSALQQSDHILSIGYKPAGESKVEEKLASINISSANWKMARQQVLNMILQSESKTRKQPYHQ
ncbi:MAG: hypothetical protein IPP72_02765 [Chitinophagaceae bacterium]|nr:hypothetical protein [Chitinophagaceae bacterium]